MTQDIKASPIWGWIGKIGALVALIWGIIQIITTALKVEEYEAEAKGNHTFYATSPVLHDCYTKNVDYRAIVKTIIKEQGALKDFHLDTLIWKYSKKENTNFGYYQFKYRDKSLKSTGDYKEIWTFTIKNTGTKPIEELALELPFDGYYETTFPNKEIKSKNFKNRIELGELRPSYDITVYCWTEDELYYPEQGEAKTRFTHKNGWFPVSFAAQADGIYVWLMKYSDIVIFCTLVFLVVLFAVAFGLGESNGRKQRVKELKLAESNKPEQVD